MHNSQCTIVERAVRAYLNRDEITWFCLRIDTNSVLSKYSDKLFQSPSLTNFMISSAVIRFCSSGVIVAFPSPFCSP